MPPVSPPAGERIAALYQHATDLEAQGQSAAAERAYLDLLALDPRHVDALHNLGLLLCLDGREARGLELLASAINACPANADLHNSYGSALYRAGRNPEALAAFDLALALDAGLAWTHSNRGMVLRDLNNLPEAASSFARAAELAPDRPGLHAMHATMLFHLNRYAEAADAFARAVALKSDSANLFADYGRALARAGRYAEALASFDNALALQADRPDVHYDRGNVLRDLGRLEDAVAAFARAVAIDPKLAHAHANRGNLLLELGELEAALACLDQALALAPNDLKNLSNRGVVLQDLKRHDEALASYDRAIAIDANFAEAHWNRAITLLQLGQFDTGWRLYEWRKRKAEPIANPRLAAPAWLGAAPIAGKTLFLHAEQGLGDTLQFSRYATLARAQGAKLVLSVQAPLVRLLKQMEPEITIIGPDAPPPICDFHAPLMSLPLAFATTLDTIPPSNLHALPTDSATWAARLGSTTKRRIGLVWRGNAAHKNDRNRSLTLSHLRPLLEIDAEWISLQKDISPTEAEAIHADGRIRNFAAELGDFADTAGLIDQLDLVISVDTSVAHLAATMGKPTWIVLPFNADFRWMLERTDSPWYPRARLFRQTRMGDQEAVILQIAAEVRAL